MNTLKFSVFIKAPKKKVWNTMLQDSTYRQWTKPFNETSYYEGDWSEGSDIRFLGTDEKGNVAGGMISRIAKNTLFEYVSIQHRGVLMNGKEEIWDKDKQGYENYSFKEKNGGTQVDIELTNIPQEYTEMMSAMWPKALDVLKKLSE